jgi:hypothetical protein
MRQESMTCNGKLLKYYFEDNFILGGDVVSDTLCKIIPEDYNFFPSNTNAIDGAVKILEMYVPAEKISWKSYKNPIFVDCGSNFESVSCPFCGNRIDIDVWQKMMSLCYERTNFNNLDISLSCCNNVSTLNDLIYHYDCGFSKFVIEILNL